MKAGTVTAANTARPDADGGWREDPRGDGGVMPEGRRPRSTPHPRDPHRTI
jgi:hypothetical protein